MKEYKYWMVGQEDDAKIIESNGPIPAVAYAAKCMFEKVGLPIWVQYEKQCYMPFDDSGRQWIIIELQI